MNTREMEKTINQKKAEAIKEAKKNRIVYCIVSGVLLALGSGMVGFGIDCVINADKITGGIILAIGFALVVAVTILMVFTDKKFKVLLKNLSKLGTEEITEEDIKEVEEEELEEAIFASTIDTADSCETKDVIDETSEEETTEDVGVGEE